MVVTWNFEVHFLRTFCLRNRGDVFDIVITLLDYFWCIIGDAIFGFVIIRVILKAINLHRWWIRLHLILRLLTLPITLPIFSQFSLLNFMLFFRWCRFKYIHLRHSTICDRNYMRLFEFLLSYFQGARWKFAIVSDSSLRLKACEREGWVWRLVGKKIVENNVRVLSFRFMIFSLTDFENWLKLVCGVVCYRWLGDVGLITRIFLTHPNTSLSIIPSFLKWQDAFTFLLGRIMCHVHRLLLRIIRRSLHILFLFIA